MLYMDFQQHGRWEKFPNPCIIQGSTVYFFIEIMLWMVVIILDEPKNRLTGWLGKFLTLSEFPHLEDGE